VYTVHNSYRNYSYRNRLLLYPVFVLFPHIVVCSKAVLESLPRSLRWLGRGKMSIVQNGVDTERVDRVLAEDWGSSKDGAFKVISVARLIERKNLLTLLAAFSRYRSAEDRLVFVGDGELASELSEQAEALEVSDRVTFAGMLSRDDVYRNLVEADVYVSTSRGEGLPVSVLEAMACEKPVILSDIPPHREIAGQAGFIPLIAPDDVDGFGREIERFRAMTQEDRRNLGIRCRQLVEDNFSLRSMHSNYERVYSRAISDASEEVR
jgi:glycosyltransferase involved in cell wall biosynthesis